MAASETDLIPPQYRPPKNDVDRRARDRMLYQLRASQSLTWLRLSEMFEVDPRTCRKIVDRYREETALDALDEEVAREVVRDTLEAYDDTLERLTIIASQNEPGGVKVAALRARMDCYRARIDLLARMGAVDVEQIRVQVDMEQAAVRLLDVFDRFSLGEEVRRAAIEALDRPALGPGYDADGGAVDVDEVP